jgi:hypothetical protein
VGDDAHRLWRGGLRRLLEEEGRQDRLHGLSAHHQRKDERPLPGGLSLSYAVAQKGSG